MPQLWGIDQIIFLQAGDVVANRDGCNIPPPTLVEVFNNLINGGLATRFQNVENVSPGLLHGGVTPEYFLCPS